MKKPPPPPHLRPVNVTVTITANAAKALDDLVSTGLYGTTREAAAEELLRAIIRHHIANGLAPLRGP